MTLWWPPTSRRANCYPLAWCLLQSMISVPRHVSTLDVGLKAIPSATFGALRTSSGKGAGLHGTLLRARELRPSGRASPRPALEGFCYLFRRTPESMRRHQAADSKSFGCFDFRTLKPKARFPFGRGASPQGYLS